MEGGVLFEDGSRVEAEVGEEVILEGLHFLLRLRHPKEVFDYLHSLLSSIHHY